MRIFFVGLVAAIALLVITALVLDRAGVSVPEHVAMNSSVRLDKSEELGRNPTFRTPPQIR